MFVSLTVTVKRLLGNDLDGETKCWRIERNKKAKSETIESRSPDVTSELASTSFCNSFSISFLKMKGLPRVYFAYCGIRIQSKQSSVAFFENVNNVFAK